MGNIVFAGAWQGKVFISGVEAVERVGATGIFDKG